MSVKKNLLAEINKKAQKIRDRRVEAANNKTLESAVFEFFKNAEEARKLWNGEKYDAVIFDMARRALQERVTGFDKGAKISIEFNASETVVAWNEQELRGVTIWWSRGYIAKNDVDPSYFIDISQMLFI